MDFFDLAALKLLGSLLLVVGLNVAFGIILAIKAGTFDVRALPRFLQTDVLPIILPLAVLAFMVKGNSGLLTVWEVVSAAALAKYIAEVKDKFTQLLGIKFEVNLFKGIKGMRLYRATARAALRMPKVGDWVFYKLAGGCLRPALVVNVFDSGGYGPHVNMLIFMDGSNDKGQWAMGAEDVPCMAWMPSVPQGDGPGQWQFPPS